ncbi:MAG: hypothetical protein K2M89_06275 [Clostridiales bacterium]|nr:hypothetical protein [Clostridiales bacterium]
MKAWLVRRKDEGTATVVFAETRGKAKQVAMWYSDGFEDVGFCDIEATRLPEIDKYYKKGKIEMDWDNPQDRIVLVDKCGFRCEYVDLDLCDKCSAREYCGAYEEFIDARGEEDDT